MKLSFVIVTRNVNKYIGSCLESVFGALADVSTLGAEAEIFSDEFDRPHMCKGCGKKIDFTQCELTGEAKTTAPR